MIRFAEEKRLEDGSRRPVLLYGKWWSADDADYAKELELDRSLRAPDLVRLWAENRPSVRAKAAGVDMSADAPMSTLGPFGNAVDPLDRVDVPLASGSFAARLVELGLSVRGAAEFLNVSAKSVQRWKAEGAPADIMAQLA